MSKKKKKKNDDERGLISRLISFCIFFLIMWHWFLGDWAAERYWLHYKVTDTSTEKVEKDINWPEENL